MGRIRVKFIGLMGAGVGRAVGDADVVILLSSGVVLDPRSVVDGKSWETPTAMSRAVPTPTAVTAKIKSMMVHQPVDPRL